MVKISEIPTVQPPIKEAAEASLRFSDDLRYLRQQLNLSQHELARKLGVYPSTISRWENKEREPFDMVAMVVYLWAKELKQLEQRPASVL